MSARGRWSRALAPLLVTLLVVAAPSMARAAESAVDSTAYRAFQELLAETEWPFGARTPAPPPAADAAALGDAEVDALFAWARGPNVGLLGAPFDSMVAAPHRARVAAIFRRLQQRGESLDRLRGERAAELEGLRRAGLLADGEARVFADGTLSPLLAWYRLEDGIPVRDTLPSTRERTPARVQRLSVFATLSRHAQGLGGETARTWAGLDRRLAGLPLAERLSFADRFAMDYDRLREQVARERTLEFTPRSRDWRALASELGAALARYLEAMAPR